MSLKLIKTVIKQDPNCQTIEYQYSDCPDYVAPHHVLAESCPNWQLNGSWTCQCASREDTT